MQRLPVPGMANPLGEFLVQKRMTVFGTVLLPGQSLPHNSPLRQSQNKLDTLSRTRHIRQITTPIQVQSDPITTTVPVVKHKIKLNGLTHKQLIQMAKERGLDHDDLSKLELRRSIRASLGS